MNNDKIDLEYLDIEQLARESWQDDLAKFFPKQKEPTYTEYRMFQAGYEHAIKKVGILEATLKQTKEQLKDIVAFIDAMETL